jgi:hypothetical protein
VPRINEKVKKSFEFRTGRTKKIWWQQLSTACNVWWDAWWVWSGKKQAQVSEVKAHLGLTQTKENQPTQTAASNFYGKFYAQSNQHSGGRWKMILKWCWNFCHASSITLCTISEILRTLPTLFWYFCDFLNAHLLKTHCKEKNILQRECQENIQMIKENAKRTFKWSVSQWLH